MRAPVGYKLAFLEQYHPNRTAYLPPDLRDQLHTMGRARTGQAPAGTFARDILNRLLIDLSWASSQLEGNTYSRLDTERLIELGQAAEGKNALETQMILNHKLAIEYLVLNPAHAQVTPDCVVALHAFLSDGLMADPTANLFADNPNNGNVISFVTKSGRTVTITHTPASGTLSWAASPSY